MGDLIYTGGATTLLDTGTITIGGTIEVGDIFKVQIGTGVVSISAATTGATAVATQLYNALNADGAGNEFDEIAWTNPSAGVIAWEGPEDGRPVSQGITVATTESNGGAADDQTITKTVTQTGTGRYSWTNVQNWSTGAIPVNSDTVHIGLYDAAPKYDIDGQDAVALTALFVYTTQFAGLSVGLDKYNAEGDYPEYLPTHLEIGASTYWLGVGTGANVPKMFINSGSNTPVYRIEKSGKRQNGIAPTNIIATSSTNIYVKDGAVDFGTYPGQTFNTTNLQIQGAGVDVRMGAYASMSSGTLLMQGGNCVIESGGDVTLATTVTLRAGSRLTLKGSGLGFTTLTVDAGAVFDMQRSGTVTFTTTILKGTITLANAFGPTGRTFTNLDLYAGAVFLDPLQLATFTNGIDLNQCKLTDVTLDLGNNRRLTVGTPS